MTKPTTALLAVLLLAGCTRTDAEAGGDSGPERIEAWQTVESYKIDQRMNILRSGQWLREPGNEDKSLEEAEAALGLQELDPRPAVEAALQIATANPVDDLGFLALSFAFYEHRSLDGPERQESQESVFGLLEAHYVNDLRLNRLLLSLIRFGGEPGVDLVDKVVASSDHRVLRARGAFWSAMERLMEVDDLKSSAAERAEVRAEVTRMAQLVADRRMDLPFVNWYVGEGSQLYEDWAIQGVPTYVVVDRDGVVRGRSHEVESLYDNIEAQEWITMPLAADTSIWTPPYFDAGGGEIWMITRSVPARDAGGIFAIVTTDLPVDAPGR